MFHLALHSLTRNSTILSEFGTPCYNLAMKIHAFIDSWCPVWISPFRFLLGEHVYSLAVRLVVRSFTMCPTKLIYSSPKDRTVVCG